MTRILKMSLGIVTLLLVAVIVLTGCGHKEMETNISNAQTTADAAKADAATSLAEAKKALTEATASLQAAIATKADSSALAAEVTNLKAAIEAAKTLASTADGALKAELEAAIATAKAVILVEAENISRTLDEKLVELINAKANDDEIQSALADLYDVIDNLKEATDGAVNAHKFTHLTGTVIVERQNLALRLKQLEDTGLYTSAWTDIYSKYIEADTYILRATSADVIRKAKNDFESLVLENGTAVDDLYVALRDFDAEGDKSAAAKKLFEDALALSTDTNTTLAGLVTKYYDNSNLLGKALNFYMDELTPIVSELGARYLVYPEHEVGAQDKADLEATSALLNTLSGQITDGTDYNAVGNLIDADAKTAFEAAVKNFADNYDRMTTVLVNAKADAEAIRVDRLDEVTLTQDNIDLIKGWQKNILDWETKYIPEASSASEEAATRRGYTAALIATAKANMEADLEALNALVDTYKQTAFDKFQKAVSYFYDGDPASTMQDLAGKDVDLSKVTLASWSQLDAAWTGAQEWMNDNNKLWLDNIYLPSEKHPSVSQAELTQLINQYKIIAERARADWETLNKVDAALTVDNITIYDTSVREALTWFEKTYVLKDGDAIVWDTVNEAEAYNLYRPAEGQPDVIVTKAYYERLKALDEKLTALITNKNTKAQELRAAINALPDVITLASRADVYAADQLRLAYVGNSDLQSIYDENSALNSTDGRDFAISVDLLTELSNAIAKIEAIEADLAALADALDALGTVPTDETYVDYTSYPFFNDSDNKQADFQTNLEALSAALAEFLRENNNEKTFESAVERTDKDPASSATITAAETAILNAKRTLAKEAIYKAMKDLRDAEAKFTVDADVAEGYRNEYFNAEITREAYVALVEALESAITAKYYEDYQLQAADVTDARLAAEDARETLGVSAVSVEYNDVLEALAVLNAIEVRTDKDLDAATPFIAADKETAYSEAIAALVTAINDFKNVPGAVAEDVTFADDAVKAANVLVAMNNVYNKYAALKAGTINAVYPYFADDAAKDAYAALAAALRLSIYGDDSIDGFEDVDTAVIDDVQVAIDALLAAELKVAKYVAFEAFYTAKYNEAVEIVENSTSDAKDEAKSRLLITLEQYQEDVPATELNTLKDAAYQTNYVDALESVLKAYNLAFPIV